VQLRIRQPMLERGVFGEQHVDRLNGLRHVTPPAAFEPLPQTRTDARPVQVRAQFGRRQFSYLSAFSAASPAAALRLP